MGWQYDTSDAYTGTEYGWIGRFLENYDGDLLEFELDVDGQHFFDNMDLLLAERSPSQPHPNEFHSSPLQLTPFILNMISGLQDPSPDDEARQPTPAPSVSFCALLEEAQAMTRLHAPASCHAATTTPRKRRSSGLRRRELTATTPRAAASATNSIKLTSRSSSRKKLNRRLFY